MLKTLATLFVFIASPLAAQTVSQTRAQVPPSTAMQTAVSANANGTAVQVGGYSSVLIVVTASVAMSGGTTINFECQSNGTFSAVSALKMGTTTVATTTTTTGDFQIAVGSYQTCRARISAYSAGTMTVVGYPSVIAPAPFVITSAAGGGAAVTIADGADVAQGTTTDARSTATDATGVTLMQVFKEISFMEQNPASRAVTNAGTFAVQAAQSGTWTVQPGNTANTTAWKVDGSAVTQPVSGTVTAAQATAANLNATVVGTGTLAVQAAQSGTWNITNVSGTVSLPTGASTAAKQPALGTAGVSSTDVISVQGIASGTALPISGSISCSNCSGSGASSVDDAAFAVGVDSVAPAGFLFDDMTPDSVNEGDVGLGRMSANRVPYATIRDAAGNERGVNVSAGNALLVDASATTQPVSGTVTAISGTAANLKAEVVGTGTAGTPAGNILTVQGVAAMTKLLVTPDSVALPANQSVNVSQINGVTPLMGNGATGTGALRVSIANDSTGIVALTTGAATIGALTANQSVNMAQVAGTNTVTAGVAGTQGIGGCVAHNVAITCNPNLISAQAVSSENAAATTARNVQLVADLVGKLIVMPYANPENNLDGTITTAMTGTTSTVFAGMGAQGGSLRVYVTACTVSNAHATVGTDVVLQDGSGGTTLWTLPAGAVYGGTHAVFPSPLKTTANTALYAANVTTGASTKISCTGYKGL